jgi:hypothetical protein
MNPIHAGFDNPRLWEAEGEVGKRTGQLKCGCRSLITVREIGTPTITTKHRIRFAILCAKKVCADSQWNVWADAWLDGTNRSVEASRKAARATALDLISIAEEACNAQG